MTTEPIVPYDRIHLERRLVTLQSPAVQILRLVMLVLLAVGVIANWTLTGPGLRPAVTVVVTIEVAVLCLGLVSFLLGVWGTRWRFAPYLQVAFDLIALQLLIYATGGPRSPLLFFLIIHAMTLALSLPRNTCLGFGLFSVALYSAVTYLLAQGEIAPFEPGMTSISMRALLLQSLSLLSGSSLAVIAVDYLQRRVSNSSTILEQSHREMIALNEAHQQVFDGIPEGIIATDLEGTITSTNLAAKQLLKLTTNHIGESIVAVLSRNFGSFELLPYTSLMFSVPREVLLGDIGDRVKSYIEFHGKILWGSNGEARSLIYVFKDVTALRSIEDRLEQQDRAARMLEEAQRRPTADKTDEFSGFLGDSRALHQLYDVLGRVAKSDTTILVSGESGTGKEVTAKAIHTRSSRADGPFVPVNCGAIPESLIESELFGHKHGAFTGATSDHGGLFRQADGGTLFLDEIGELPLQMQAKLLRALQEKRVRPVGSDRDIKINVRIIAATNRDLSRMVSEGRFREDLYYRLNVVHVRIPALRERKDDIPLLISRFLTSDKWRGKSPTISPSALDLLMRYSYPGNVRELENIIERAILLAEGVILPEHLTSEVQLMNGRNFPRTGQTEVIELDQELIFPLNLDEMLASIERDYILLALRKAEGVRKRAADLLGMNFRSFRYRLQKFGIDVQE